MIKFKKLQKLRNFINLYGINYTACWNLSFYFRLFGQQRLIESESSPDVFNSLLDTWIEINHLKSLIWYIYERWFESGLHKRTSSIFPAVRVHPWDGRPELKIWSVEAWFNQNSLIPTSIPHQLKSKPFFNINNIILCWPLPYDDRKSLTKLRLIWFQWPS